MKQRKFLKQVTKIGLFAVFALLFTVSGYAAPYDATAAGYGSATHAANNLWWQRLAEHDSNGNEINPFGVSWAISNDDGSTWSGWGNTTTLEVGQTIKFQFNMFKQYEGTHYADHLKAWVDWGQDGTFDDPADKIIYEEAAEDPNFDGLVNKQYTFNASGEYKITSDYLGEDLWLRARVTCSESLLTANGVYRDNFADKSQMLTWSCYRPGDAYYISNGSPIYVTWEDFMVDWEKFRDSGSKSYEDMFAATGYYGQGETEEWKFIIKGGSSTSEVPEPATMLLFGFGLIGLARAGRSRK